MAHRLIWSKQAADDLETVVRYIAQDSSYYARRTARRIIDACEALLEMPTASAIVPELQSAEYRQSIVWPYRIIVRLRGDSIEIVAIIHGARDATRILGDRI